MVGNSLLILTIHKMGQLELAVTQLVQAVRIWVVEVEAQIV
tara:strand:+ start:268 stop:390 length:123 start_codon:yes stop_codon:yes gene_type:complete